MSMAFGRGEHVFLGSAVVLWASGALLGSGCSDSSGTGGSADGSGPGSTGTPSATGSVMPSTSTSTSTSTATSMSTTSTSSGSGAGEWTLVQSTMRNWDVPDPTWQGGPVSFEVQQGSTLVMAVYGLSFPTVPFDPPVDSMGQPVVQAVATGNEAATQAFAWVLHDAIAGTHTWTSLPQMQMGDGKLWFMEFDPPGDAPSTTVLGAGTNILQAFVEPWLTSGSVTMSSGASPGDLLIAFSFEEEGSVGYVNTPYTDPPAGWQSLGVQNDTTINIGGEACWRTAPDATPQTVTWEWQLTGEQNPTVFKGCIFAVH